MPTTSRLLDAPALGRVLARMASEIVERTASHGPVVLVGIQRRGVQLADRLAPLIEPQLGEPLRRGVLDITLYRDDLQAIGPRPVVHQTKLPPDLDGTTVVIVDDVLFTSAALPTPTPTMTPTDCGWRSRVRSSASKTQARLHAGSSARGG